MWAWAGLGVGAIFAYQAIRRPAAPAPAPATSSDLGGAALSWSGSAYPLPAQAGGYTSTDVLQAASDQWERALQAVMAQQQPPAVEPAPAQQPAPAQPEAPAGATPGADWARFNASVQQGLQLSRDWFKATTPAQRAAIHQQAEQWYRAAAAAIGGRYEYLPGSGVTHIYDASGQLVFTT